MPLIGPAWKFESHQLLPKPVTLGLPSVGLPRVELPTPRQFPSTIEKLDKFYPVKYTWIDSLSMW